jgi:DNA-binding CsgD family transcriptional regulator
MLEMQRQLQLLGAEPSYEREAALMDRLGQKALALIKEYGQDVEKVPAIAMVAIKTAADIELLGSDQYGRSADLTKAISVMYENAIEELFAMLVDEHDYGTVHTILETARASLLLSDTSGVDTDEIINRLQKALHFELTINYYYEQTGNHRWVEQAVFDVEAVFEGSEIGNISGSGSGSMLSFIWDDEPELSVTAPDFPVQAVFTKFNPCDATVELRLTPFHPLTETLHTDGESMDWPLLKTSWEVAFTENLQEDGFYRFGNWITFHNQFTKDNITLILSLREYHIAQSIARHIPYKKVAEQHCVSLGRLGNIMQDIYQKLSVSGREELAKYVL